MTVRVSTLLIIAFIFNAIICMALFATGPLQDLVNSNTILYMLCLSIIIIIPLAFYKGINYPLLVFLAIYVLEKYCGSVVGMLIIPRVNGGWRFSSFESFTHHDVNHVMIYAIFSTFMFVSALCRFSDDDARNMDRSNDDISSTKSMLPIKPKTLLIMVIFLLGIRFLYNTFVYDVYQGSSSANANSNANFLSLFINPSPFIWLSLGYIILKYKSLIRSDFRICVVILCLCSVVSYLSGSRSFIYSLSLLTVFLFFVKFRSPTIPVRSIPIFALVAFSAILLFGVTSGIRYAIHNRLSFKSVINSVKWLYFNNNQRHDSAFALLATDVLLRVTNLPPSLAIMNDRWKVPPEKYINLKTILEDSINGCVPQVIGKPFDDVIRGPAVYSFVYLGLTDPTIYNTEYFGIYEYIYLFFGYVAALPILYIYALLISYVWRKIAYGKSVFKPFIIVWFCEAYWELLINMGASLFITAIIRNLLVIGLYYGILNAFNGIRDYRMWDAEKISIANSIRAVD